MGGAALVGGHAHVIGGRVNHRTTLEAIGDSYGYEPNWIEEMKKHLEDDLRERGIVSERPFVLGDIQMPTIPFKVHLLWFCFALVTLFTVAWLIWEMIPDEGIRP